MSPAIKILLTYGYYIAAAFVKRLSALGYAMTVKRLVCSYTSQRLLVAQEWIETVSHDGELVVLGPTRGAVDDLVRNLSLKTGGLLGVHRMTLFQLAASLATPHLAAEQLSALSLLG